MAAMTSDGMLDMLLAAINKDDVDTEAERRYLSALLESAQGTINGQVRRPIDLDDSRDAILVVDYANFLWRSRASTGEATELPRNLRERINQRIFDYSDMDPVGHPAIHLGGNRHGGHA